MSTDPIAASRPSRRSLLAAGLLGVPLIIVAAHSLRAAEAAVPIPPPAVDAPASAGRDTAILAGGCFWGVQGVFQHVKGVTSAVSGYAGGDQGDGRLRHGQQRFHRPCRVGAGSPSIRIRSPMVRSCRSISPWRMTRPSSTGRGRTQERNTGRRSSRRTASRPRSPAPISPSSTRRDPSARKIATRIEPNASFFPAEGYHQDFLERNPSYPYIVINDLPKVENLKRVFPQLYRSTPVLVASSG